MLVSPHTDSLAEYFQHSRRFFYVVADSTGIILHMNPLYNELLDELELTGPDENFRNAFIGNEEILNIAWNMTRSQPGIPFHVDLTVRLKNDSLRTTRWELTCRGEQDSETIQAIGFTAILLTSGIKLPTLQERFSALEQSAQGLWMFDTTEPVPVNASPEEFLSSWRKHSYLGECNDNMAQMYGFEKASELIGTRLEQFIDFTDESIIGNLTNFIRNGFQSKEVETREFDRYGNIKYFLNSMVGVIENGHLARVWGTQQDITTQRQAEQQLKESELFYRSLIADSLDGMLLTDGEGVISFGSPSVTRILGYLPEEIVHTSAFEYVHPEDREEGIRTFLEEARNEPRVKAINIRLLKKDGEYIWCMVRGHNLMSNPIVRRMVIYFADDTMRKDAELALLESGRTLRTQARILNNVTDVIVTTDKNRVITSWNKVIEKLSGITEAEAMGKMIRQVLDTDYSPYTHEQVREIVFREGIWRGEISFTGCDGEKKYLLHTVSLLQEEHGETIGLLGVGKDITERKKIEDRLQQSELFYRNLAANSLDGILMTDEEGLITYCGPSVNTVSGHELYHLLGKTIFNLIHPEDVQSARETFYTDAQKRQEINYIVIRLRHATRGWIWCTMRGHRLFQDPAENAVVIYFTDDTKRKDIEDRLRESEKEFRTLIYSLSLGVVLQNERTEVILYNPAAQKILGVNEKDLANTSSYDRKWKVIFEDGRECLPGEHPAPVAIRTKKPVRDLVLGLQKISTNERVWLLISAEPIIGPDGKVVNVITSFADITEQKRLTQQLIEQEVQRQRQLTQATIDGQEKERQEIGKELHDNINQHLTTTRLYLEVAREKADGEVLEMIRLAHKNLADIVNEIRQLSQSLVPPTLGDLGLVESVYELCDSLKRAHPFHVEFQHRHFSEETLPDNLKLMIFRIIQEQVSNVIHHSQATAMQVKLQSDAEYIIVSITDNGKGFDFSNYKKGMGLNNISNRADLFAGKVEINTAPGQGCSVSVIIPQPA